MLSACFMPGLLFDSENIIRNICWFPPEFTALCPRRWYLESLPWKPHVIPFENRVLRRIFGPKGVGGNRRLERITYRGTMLLSLSLNIIMTNKSERERWPGYVARIGKKMNSYILVVKPERRRPLERPRHGWEDDIKMDLQEIG